MAKIIEISGFFTKKIPETFAEFHDFMKEFKPALYYINTDYIFEIEQKHTIVVVKIKRDTFDLFVSVLSIPELIKLIND